MASATINYDNDMMAWPPKTYLVNVDPPLRRFDAETGEPEDFSWIALTVQESDPKQSFVFPTDENGNFVDQQMIPMRRKDYGLPHSILTQLGYTPTN